jgi:hypothetical protein
MVVSQIKACNLPKHLFMDGVEFSLVSLSFVLLLLVHKLFIIYLINSQ